MAARLRIVRDPLLPLSGGIPDALARARLIEGLSDSRFGASAGAAAFALLTPHMMPDAREDLFRVRKVAFMLHPIILQ